MGAALTIAILMAVSVTVVRVAAVAMRLTGLTDAVARFQCLSALTGTGFTTRESEMIVNYPVRRRILMGLMIVGNLGLVSVAATFIVAFVGSEGDTDVILNQALAIGAAIAVILVMTTFRPLDRVMCAAVAGLLTRTTSLAHRRYQRILQLEDGYCVAEHVMHIAEPDKLESLMPDTAELTSLAVRTGDARDLRTVVPELQVNPGDIVICFGPESAHDALEDALGQQCHPGGKVSFWRGRGLLVRR